MEQRYTIPNPFVSQPRRKVFISYHEADRAAVENFIKTFGPDGLGVFTHKAVGLFGQGDFVDSTNPEYVMRRIREKYLEDSSVTIVLLGHCTHSRRYIDWELKASLTQPVLGLPNGVVGIVLPSLGGSAHIPDRFRENWKEGHADCYAKLWAYPTSAQDLRGWIEDAFEARSTRRHLISNSRDMMGHSAKCRVHDRVCNTEPETISISGQISPGALAALQPNPYLSSYLAAVYGQQQPKSSYSDLMSKLLAPQPTPWELLARALYGKRML